ncbi:hypothetical protein [Pseudonocardia endophytica]|uniref:Dolichyl-phosphate-mannose-protein mannosyltransferase n=1 Tax=Pseudonocardia endophytica TaxID=401976 RepID=A0A4R1HY42_PSEEN|nr:hypothetical protein [Pseudonocardia endophytica]TCK22482.1 hypothetical protein EV378_6486 [Pseudonocardia endophytica]
MLTAPERPSEGWSARPERVRPSRPMAIGMAVVVVAVAVGVWATWSTTIDDAFITFRYALNWAHGDGPVWNPGEDPVEGFTNFAWTAWAVPFLAMGAPPEVVAKLTSAVCAVLTGWLLLREPRTTVGRVGAVGAFLLFLPTYLHIVAGLETVAFALVVLRAVIVGMRVLDGRDARVWELPVLLLAGGMLRPEGALAVAPALVCWLWLRRRDRTAWLWTGGAAVVGAGYFLWRWSFFGHLLPNTFYVKFGHLDAGERWISATVWALLPLLVLVVLLAARTATRRPGVLALVTVVLLWAPYAVSGPSMDYVHRFAFHAVPVLCLAAGLALDALRPRVVAAVVGVVAVGWTAVAGVSAPDAPVILNYGTDLQRTHEAIGRGLAESPVPGPQRTLAVTDAGAIPYFSEWNAIDYIGLNDEAIAHGAAPTDVVGAASPTVIVVTGGAGGPPVAAYGLDVGRVTAGYERVASVWLRENYWQYVFVKPEFAGPVGAAVRTEVGRAQAESDGRWDESWDRWFDRVTG